MTRTVFPQAFSLTFGLLMVAAAGRPFGIWGLVVVGLAVLAMLAGVFLRPVSVLAVLVTIAGMAAGDPVPLLAAVSGLSAAAYLLSRYAEDAVTLTVPTVIGMLGFTMAAVAASAVPVQMSWVPLVAPAIMTGILIVVVLPLVAGAFTGPSADREPPG